MEKIHKNIRVFMLSCIKHACFHVFSPFSAYFSSHDIIEEKGLLQCRSRATYRFARVHACACSSTRVRHAKAVKLLVSGTVDRPGYFDQSQLGRLSWGRYYSVHRLHRCDALAEKLPWPYFLSRLWRNRGVKPGRVSNVMHAANIAVTCTMYMYNRVAAEVTTRRAWLQ